MLLAASLLTGIAAGAAAGGWGLLPGLVLAGLFAVASARAWERADPVLRATVLLVLAALAARTFAAYLLPANVELAAAVAVVVGTLAAIVVATTGGELSAASRRLLAGVLLAAAASFAAICFGISPPPPAAGGGSTGGWGWGPLGVLAAAGLFAAPFAVLEPAPKRQVDGDLPAQRPRLAHRVPQTVSVRVVVVRVAAGVAAAVAVAAGALHQLGPVRLGLSDAPLQDALAAADAAALRTMLSAVVLVATLPAVLAGIGAASRELSRRHSGPQWVRTAAIGAVAAAGAALLEPAALLVVASTVVVVTTLLSWSRKRIPRTS